MQTQTPLRISPETLRKFCQEILIAAGVAQDAAGLVADSLAKADACGLFSHGAVRLLPVYVRRLLAGATRPAPNIQVVHQMGGVALVDGDAGLGQIVGTYAMRHAISLARRCGVGVVGVRNSSHFGAGAFFTQETLAADMIGVVMTNAPSNMPPWGGRKPYFGTNPLCIALPCGVEAPVVLDMSTSVVARGKIVMAATTGQTIPAGWAIDQEGRPTQDAQAALEGAVLPMGGYKGSGLALVIDALCGVLTGAAFGSHIVNLYDGGNNAQNLGHFFMALNIDSLMPAAEFKARMDRFVQEIRAQPTMPGVERIYVPGELEHEAECRSRQEGILLPGAGVLEQLAEQLGVAPLQVRL
jgi:LDH2 family malate/lactate/ureidoglycolate dehydrogenase